MSRSETMQLLTPVRAEHADRLYKLIKDSSITDTLLWDGPTSLDEFRSGLKDRELRTAKGELHQFTVLDPASGEPIGSADIRLSADETSAEIGLWIGTAFQGKGIGTEAVRSLARYGFEHFKIGKITSRVFVGNEASRRVFEKCGFSVEGDRGSATKRGKQIDAWLLTLRREECDCD